MAFNIVNDPTVVSTGGEVSSGITLADVSSNFVSEEIIASYEYDSLAAGIDFSGAFDDFEKGEDAVVRFRLGCEYSSTTQLRMQIESNSTMQTGNVYWWTRQGFQQSTSAYNSSSTAQPNAELCGGGGYDWWEGEIIFPYVNTFNASNNATQTVSYLSKVYNMKYNPSSNAITWTTGGVQSVNDTKITGFRIYENSWGSATREIGKPTWSPENAWIEISKRVRAPTT